MISRIWAALAVLLPLSAVAETALVATGRCEHGGNERHARALRDALERRAGLDVLTEAQTRDRLGGAPRASLADAERQISGSRIDFFQGNLARAERTLKAALEDLLRMPPSQDRWKGLASGLTMLVQVQLKDGREDDAKRTARRLVRVDRRYVPDRDSYPPSIRDFFERARKEVQAEPTHDVIVTTRPAGLVVHLDGRPLTKAPFKLKLPLGTYRLEAEYGSGAGIPREIKAGEVASIELNEDFEGAVFADRGPCLKTPGGREERLIALVRLAALLRVDRVISVREEEPANAERYLVASVVDVGSGEESREARVKIYGGGFAPGSIDRLADFLATGEAEPPVQALRGSVEKPQQQPEPVAAATGADDAPKVTQVVPSEPTQPPPAIASASDAATVKSEEKVSRLPSYLAFGTGTALLAGSGYFLLQANATDAALNGLRERGVFRAGSETQVTTLNGQLASQQTTAAALAAAAGGALITGAIMWAIEGPSAKEIP